ncbi:MAG TPA: SCO family protein [Candidatus Binataceae bacterium]|nr:SCO family protein [Candidatus Binataceae bacterium]
MKFQRYLTTTSLALLALVFVTCLVGCHRSEDAGPGGGFAVLGSSDCLPPTALLDQHGQKVSLADLKGKPILFDFIYTSCPGECLALTMRMKRIASALGPELGKQVRLVSITVDPEHDQPKQLLQYASDQGADLNGWLFLTGTPAQIDDVMRRFKLVRQRESDGSVDHVLEMFLVAPDGHALLQYMGDEISVQRAVADLNAAAAGKAVTSSEGTIQTVRY